MKRIFSLLLVIVLLNACHPPQTKLMDFAEGASMAHPVILKESTDGKTIFAEYAWIKDHYKFYEIVGQRLVSAPHGRKNYDVITIEHVDGAKQDVYFKINKSYTKSHF